MPLYSDVLKNTNSNAPCLNVNDLQVKGFGIFADTAARDALNETIRTEGYMASMKDDDKLYVYASSDSGDTAWQDAANWVAIGSNSNTISVVARDNINGGVACYNAGTDETTGLPLVSDAPSSVPVGIGKYLGVRDYYSGSVSAGDTFDLVVNGAVTAIVYVTDRNIYGDGGFYNGQPLYVHPRYVNQISPVDSSGVKVGYLMDATPIESFYRKVYLQTNPTTTWFDGVGYGLSHRVPIQSAPIIPHGNLYKIDTSGINGIGGVIVVTPWVEGTDNISTLKFISVGNSNATNGTTSGVTRGPVTLALSDNYSIGASIYIESGGSGLTPTSTSGVSVGIVIDDHRNEAFAVGTFTGVPSDGDTIEFNSNTFYFVSTVNSGNARNEIEMGSLTSASDFAILFKEVVDAGSAATGSGSAPTSGNSYYIDSLVLGLRAANPSTSVGDLVYVNAVKGSAGNSYTATSSSSAFSWTQTFSGGTDDYECYIDI